jgi:hypothetical protein
MSKPLTTVGPISPRHPSRKPRVSRACVACQQKKQKVCTSMFAPSSLRKVRCSSIYFYFQGLFLSKILMKWFHSVMGRPRLVGTVSNQIEVSIARFSPLDLPLFFSARSLFASRCIAYCINTDRVTACISNDPSTQRQHPRGYLESLESHNALLEQHIAFLESKLKDIQPTVDINRITSNTDDSESYNSGNDVSYQEPSFDVQ